MELDARDLETAFPSLADLAADHRAWLSGVARLVRVPPGRAVFHEGSACEAFLMVLDGVVKVRKVSDSGREILLYRVERGQTCVLTTACLMARAPYGAEGITETPVTAAALPAGAFAHMMEVSAAFRAFVFGAYATRVSDLLMLIEEVAFGRIDARMAQVLLAHARDGIWSGTHQDLAVELGSAREVISRQLKEFERRGWVDLARGRVTLRAPQALAALCGQGGDG